MTDVLSNQHQNDGNEEASQVPVEFGVLEVGQANEALLGPGLFDGGEVNLTTQHGGDVANDDAQQNRQAANHALEEHGNQDDGAQRHQGGHGCFHEVVLGGRRQVEANQRHDGAGHYRGHELGQPAGSGDLNNQANNEQGDTGHDDTAQGTAGAVLVGSRGQGRDEGEGRAQVGGHASCGDQQEEHGADTREEKGGGWREAGQQGHQEGRTKHGHDVLGADTDGAAPGEAFEGADDAAGSDVLAVAMQGPGEAKLGALSGLGTVRHEMLSQYVGKSSLFYARWGGDRGQCACEMRGFFRNAVRISAFRKKPRSS